MSHDRSGSRRGALVPTACARTAFLHADAEHAHMHHRSPGSFCAFSASDLALRTPPSFDVEGRWRHLAAVAAGAPQRPSELQESLPSTGGDRKRPCRGSSVERVCWCQRPAASLGRPPPTPLTPLNQKKTPGQVKRSHVGLTVHPFVLQICVCLLQLFPDLW